MNINAENYSLSHDEDNNIITITGALRLNGMGEYAPVLESLQKALELNDKMVIDLSGLVFLNSSGIAMLSKFIIQARGKAGIELTVKGSSSVPWQGKSLKNLQRLFPKLNLEIN